MKGDAITKSQELARGWPVLVAAFAGIMTGIYAMPFYIIGPLATPLHADFGWDRTSILTVASFLNLGQFLGTPLAGRLADRFGPRPVAVVSMAILALGMAGLALGMQSIATFHFGYLALGFLCAGSGSVSFTRAIGLWFRRARGLALGFAMAGTGISAFLAPLLVEAATERGGWRSAMLVVSALTTLAIPVIVFGLKTAPVAAPPDTRRDAATPGLSAHETHWAQAVRDPRFHILVLICLLLGLFVGGIVLHTMPLLIEEGFSPRRAAAIASLNGIALIVGRVLIGWLLDRFPTVWLALFMFVGAATGCLALALAGSAAAVIMVVTMGLMIGSEIDLLSFLVARYFGLKSYGAIYGALFSLYIGVSLTSPWITGALVKTGGYPTMFFAAAATFTLVGILFIVLDRLDRPRSMQGAVALSQ